MKKPIIFFIVILIFNLNARSQSSSASSGSTANGADKSFHFGLNFTPGLYFPSTSAPAASNGISFGYGYGVNLESISHKTMVFAQAWKIASFGANWTNTTPWIAKNGDHIDSATAHQYSLEYLEIPIQFKFRTLPIGLIRYFGIVGFNPGFRVSSSDNYTVSGQGINPAGNDRTVNYSQDNVALSGFTSIIRLSYVIGAGLEYNIAGTTSIQTSINYDAGFLNTNSKSNGAFSGSVVTKGITLTVGILF